jgi:hypothetical protein
MREVGDLDSDFCRQELQPMSKEKQFNHPQISQINADQKRLTK